jgi:hypothetical protein
MKKWTNELNRVNKRGKKIWKKKEDKKVKMADVLFHKNEFLNLLNSP